MQSKTKSKNVSVTFCDGEIVWCKFQKERVLWPGMVINHKYVNVKKPSKDKVVLYWFGDHRISFVEKRVIYNFKQFFNSTCRVIMNMAKPLQKLVNGVNEALKAIAYQLGIEPTGDLTLYNREETDKLLKQFHLNRMHNLEKLPNIVLNNIIKIKKQQPPTVFKEFKKVDDFDKSNTITSTSTQSKCCVSSVNSGKIDLSKTCICCDKVVNLHTEKEHPLFQVPMCQICYEIAKKVIQLPDMEKMCVLCTQLYEDDCVQCNKTGCKYNFCKICIVKFCGMNSWKKLNNNFICFLCKDYDSKIRGLLLKKPDISIDAEMMNMVTAVPEYFIPPVPSEKRRIRVLSLFDGISTGYYVLKKLNFDIEVYYASEIAEDAISVSRYHYGNEITHIGDITRVKRDNLIQMLPIDLVIGGSPCNDLSRANPNRKGLTDTSGTGVLFFHFYRVLKELHLGKPDHHIFWFYENVASMSPKEKLLITSFLDVPPVSLNAKYVSSQERNRLFWGNLPNLNHAAKELECSTTKTCMKDHLATNLNRTAAVNTLRTVTTNSNSLKQGPSKVDAVIMEGETSQIWVTELESIFGFPTHYTDVGGMSKSRRLRLLGKGWSVQVIEHILKPLLHHFKTLDE